MAPSGPKPALSVVMPVYNEEACIDAVLEEWSGVLDRVVGDYELRVYDDGSRDGTGELLRRAADRHPRLVAVTHSNRGHGPSVMRGYFEAEGDWVFQTDSDGELAAAHLAEFWSRRDQADLILGVRTGRQMPLHRMVLTGASRVITAALFGLAVRDVNVPYRLMRAEWLRKQLPRMPQDAAVPNVILSGLAARTGARILQLPVLHTNRRTGSTSLNLPRIVRLAVRATVDSIRVAAGKLDR